MCGCGQREWGRRPGRKSGMHPWRYCARNGAHKKVYFACKIHARSARAASYGFYLKVTRWSNGRFRIKNLLTLRGTIKKCKTISNKQTPFLKSSLNLESIRPIRFVPGGQNEPYKQFWTFQKNKATRWIFTGTRYLVYVGQKSKSKF